jgi:hypothetical protein
MMPKREVYSSDEFYAGALEAWGKALELDRDAWKKQYELAAKLVEEAAVIVTEFEGREERIREFAEWSEKDFEDTKTGSTQF